MAELLDKGVWLDDMERVLNVIELLERVYPSDVWQGGVLFKDRQAGFVLIITLDPQQYPGSYPSFESLFPTRDLRRITLEEACFDGGRYRPFLGGDIPSVLGHLKLLPT